MRIRIAFFGLLAATLIGCSSTPPQKAEPVSVAVTVTLPNGQPGRDLNLMMLPTSSDQMQGGGKTDANGKVNAKLTPGKYTYAFDGNPTAVPKKYHNNDTAHAVEVPTGGGAIAIKLNN